MIKVACIQHVPYEPLGIIDFWVKERGIELTIIDPKKGRYPSHESYDMLIILGGPMSVNDEIPWFPLEKRFISEAIAEYKYVIGICLGAQLIASELGAEVIKSPEPEIGYYPINRTSESDAINDLIATIPPELTVFHWHSDMFEIPQGAKQFAFSEGCPNQSFLYNDRVLALQFHLETTPESLELLLENCSEDLEKSGTFISTAEDMRVSDKSRDKKMNGVLLVILDSWLSKIVMQ